MWKNECSSCPLVAGQEVGYTSDTHIQTAYNNIPTDQRDYDVGVANRDNVQRMLASVALYPLTEILGYVCQKRDSEIPDTLDTFMQYGYSGCAGFDRSGTA